MTIEDIMKMAVAQGKNMTREQAAFHLHCFKEAEKRNISPITIAMEIMNTEQQRENLGVIQPANSHGDIATITKPSWQL